MSQTFHYPLFSRNDMSAFWALFTDNLTNLIVLSGICKFVFHIYSPWRLCLHLPCQTTG